VEIPCQQPTTFKLDFLSLGALVHRLDPGVIPFRKARSVEIHVSGGEYNVAAGLSDGFGLNTGLIIEAMKAAKAHGAITSIDLNYRPKLWVPMGGLEQAQKTFRAIVENVDVLLGPEEDLQPGPINAGFAEEDQLVSYHRDSDPFHCGPRSSHILTLFPEMMAQ
jgi:hypothetical protein